MLQINNDTLIFAVLSDTHSYYDQLQKAVASINTNENVQFVICCGDITDAGLSDEFNLYYSIINDLNKPIITVIGNHDYLSNGARVYAEMFGPNNFSFYCGNYRFLLFSDIVWENDNKSPDFFWLKKELTNDSVVKTVIVAHLPPWAGELSGNYESVYQGIVSQSNTILALHGHDHSYKIKEVAGIPSVVINTVKKKVYYIVKLYECEHTIEQVDF
jgi:predicted phosphodiesterase